MSGVIKSEGLAPVFGNAMNRPVELMKPSNTGTRRMAKPTGRIQPIRVLLVDASVLTLHGLNAILSKYRTVTVVGMARTKTEALAAIPACRPDVVVSEVRVGRASGIDLCRVIHESYPTISVLFLTDDADAGLMRPAILAGAQGYLLKTASGEEVVKAIEAVSFGHAAIDQRLTQQVIAWIRHKSPTVPHATEDWCSSDDLRLLALVASGRTNKEIARRLNVTIGAVTSRLRRIYKGLGASRKSEVARYYAGLEKYAHGRASREDE